MAITVTMESYDSDRIITASWTCDILDGARRAHGPSIISADGVMRPGESAVAGTINKFTCKSTASDIGGYKVLGRNLGYFVITLISAVLVGGAPPEESPLEEFATSSVEMQGKVSNGSTENLSVRAKRSAGVGNVYVVVEAYHRTSGGTETEIASVKLGPLTASFADYSLGATITQAWTTSERLVIKFIARDEGVPT